MSITCNEKGIVFFTDTIFSSIIMLVITLVFVFFISNQINIYFQEEKNFFLEEKTIFLADSFVKNFDSNNSLFGVCKVDLEKKRVLSNELTNVNFSNIKQIELENYFVKEIKIKYFVGGEKIIFSDLFVGRECFAVRRFVFVDDKKAEIHFRGCSK
jgi:hypothetical protein